jgi:hypothetical protein
MRFLFCLFITLFSCTPAVDYEALERREQRKQDSIQRLDDSLRRLIETQASAPQGQIDPEVLQRIKDKAAQMFPDDYRMQEYSINEQIQAYRRLNKK